MSQSLDQYELVDLRNRRDDALLHAFYTDLYLPAFPIVSEQEDPAVWAPRLWDAAGRLELHILVAGSQLADPKRRTLVGGVAFELYRESRCGLLTYLVVAPSARRCGLGRQLVDKALALLSVRAAETGDPLRAVFAETNDPSLVSAERDSMDPRRRLVALGRLGAQILAMQYVQPELKQGQGRSHELLLIAFPLSADQQNAIESACVLAFLEDFYRTNGTTDPSMDREFQAMVASMPRPVVPMVGHTEIRQP